jgi:hypothetical protein
LRAAGELGDDFQLVAVGPTAAMLEESVTSA